MEPVKFLVGEGANQKEVMLMAEFHTFDPRRVRLEELEKAMEMNEKEFLPLHEEHDKKWIEYMHRGLDYNETPEGEKEKSKLRRLATKGLKIRAEIIALQRELGVFE